MIDDEVARIISEEAARRRARARIAGVGAYLEREPAPPSTRPGDVNKQFLGRTVGAVLGHNRRNQESQCWQQRGLESAVHSLGKTSRESRGEKRPRSVEEDANGDRVQAKVSSDAAQLEQQASREAWALKKATQAAAANEAALSIAASSSSEVNEKSDSVKSRKREKKEAKKKKSKRHKEERKKSKRGSHRKKSD